MFASFTGQASTLGQRTLLPDDYQRVLRAVIMTEKRINVIQHVSMGDGTYHTPVMQTEAGPMTPQYAMNECGDTATMLAYYLQLQGVPKSQLYFYQMQDDSSTQFKGFLGPSASPHEVLSYQTKNSAGATIFILLDITFMQFHSAVQKLEGSPTGLSVLQSIYEDGFWIASDANLATYSANFELIGPTPNRTPTQTDLPMNYIEDLTGEWQEAMSTGRSEDYNPGTELTDPQKLSELVQITPAMIQNRNQQGTTVFQGLK